MTWILHPTDNQADSEPAFRHALRIALAGQLGIRFIYVSNDMADPLNWRDFPKVRDQLQSWGFLPAGSERQDVPRLLGMDVYKETIEYDSPTDAIVQRVDQLRPKLVVLGTEARRGLPRWLHPSVAERVARRTETATLFVPENVPGFVEADGTVTLRRILLPVDHMPNHAAAVRVAAQIVDWLQIADASVSVLHVERSNGARAAPAVQLPSQKFPHSAVLLRSKGAADEEIIDVAQDVGANLIVMATAGHGGILDALRGSTSERVLRHAPCPILAVPTASI